MWRDTQLPAGLRIGIVGDNLLSKSVGAGFGYQKQVDILHIKTADEIDNLTEAKPTLVFICMDIEISDDNLLDDTEFLAVSEKIAKNTDAGICIRTAIDIHTLRRYANTVGMDKFIGKTIYNPYIGDPKDFDAMLSSEYELLGGHEDTIKQHRLILESMSHFSHGKIITGTQYDIAAAIMVNAGYKEVRQKFFTEMWDVLCDSGLNPMATRKVIEQMPDLTSKSHIMPTFIRSVGSDVSPLNNRLARTLLSNKLPILEHCIGVKNVSNGETEEEQ